MKLCILATLVLLICLPEMGCDKGRANYQCTLGTIAFNIVFEEPVKAFFAKGKYETCGTTAEGTGSFKIQGKGTQAEPYEGQIKPADQDACGNVRSENGYRNITLIATKNAGVVHIDDFIVEIGCHENETLSITKSVSFGTSSSTPNVRNVPGVTANTKMKAVDGNLTDAKAVEAVGSSNVVMNSMVKLVVEFEANPILKDYLVVDCRAHPDKPGTLIPMIDINGCPVTTFRVYDDNKLMQTKQKIGTVLSTIVLPPYKAFKFPGVDKKNVYVRCTLLLCLEGETHCKLEKCPATTGRGRRNLGDVRSAEISTKYRVLWNDSLVTDEVVEKNNVESQIDSALLATIIASVGALVLICVIGWIVCLKVTRKKPTDEKSQNPN